MIKKITALILCLLMLGTALVGCAKKDPNDKGAYINMYLTDMVYDLDPANAYTNESALKIVSLLYDNLFVLNKNGKVKKSLAKDYEIIRNPEKNEYKMIITLNETKWSDGILISADDVVFAWKRILDNEKSFAAAALLYDIKNARAAKEGDASIDDVAIYALNSTEVSIEFEKDIDYDQFLLNLTSYALVPLRETAIDASGDDWAKKPSTMITSGPFKLRVMKYEDELDENGEPIPLKQMILERNMYYYRDIIEDDLDKSVKPYRIIVDYNLTDEQIVAKYNEGKLFYIGNIPLSVRGTLKDQADVVDAMSTHSYIPNQNAVVRYFDASDFKSLSRNYSTYKNNLKEGVDGDKIFAKADVRKALSLAIDRNAIANAVVFAKAASGLVPYGVYNADSKKDSFREIGGNIIASEAKLDEARQLLANAGVDAKKYMFSIAVASYDDVHMAIAEMVKNAWTELGFNVAINAIDVAVNDEMSPSLKEVATDIMDDIFTENFKAGNFDVAAIDYCAMSPDAFSVLAPFAKGFSGEKIDMMSENYEINPYISGYDNADYNKLIEDALAQKNIKERATILHEAEKKLLDDMAIIPIIFNQNATITSKDLSKISVDYYGFVNFKKAKLKDYELYIPVEE